MSAQMDVSASSSPSNTTNANDTCESKMFWERLLQESNKRNPTGVPIEKRRETQMHRWLMRQQPNLIHALRQHDSKTLAALEREGVEDAKHFRLWLEGTDSKVQASLFDKDFINMYTDAVWGNLKQILQLAKCYRHGCNGVIRDTDKAQEWLQHAAANLHSSKAAQELGELLQKLGQHEQATPWLEQAMITRQHYGLYVYEEQGERSEAYDDEDMDGASSVASEPSPKRARIASPPVQKTIMGCA